MDFYGMSMRVEKYIRMLNEAITTNYLLIL